MSDLVKLLVICLVMGFSSYGVGLIPLSFPLSPHKIQAISVLGSGILVGTALVVIIPEGVSMIFSTVSQKAAPDSSSHSEHPHLFARHGLPAEGMRTEVGLSLLLGFLFMYIIEKLNFLFTAFSQMCGDLPFGFMSSRSSFAPLSNSIDMSTLRNSIFGRLNTSNPSPDSPNDSLISGSELPRHSLGNRPITEPPYNHHHRTDSLVGLNGDANDLNDSPANSSTGVGLIIHAIADGIALGASITSGNSSIETIVFLAIMIHKAPASFGLAAVVLQEKGTAGAKRTLAIFAAAAPLGALLTYGIISLLGESSRSNLDWWTGVLLLFSGGTFLYVAVHVMQELDQSGSHQQNEHSNSSIYNSNNTSATSGANALLGIIGMLLPCLTLFVPEE